MYGVYVFIILAVFIKIVLICLKYDVIKLEVFRTKSVVWSTGCNISPKSFSNGLTRIIRLKIKVGGRFKHNIDLTYY